MAVLFGSMACAKSETPIPDTVKTEHVTFPATIDGRVFNLEATIYRPADEGIHPAAIMNHGRNGKNPAVNQDESQGYVALNTELAVNGYVSMMLVRRGYGNSQGPDSELKETAVDSGLEAAKDIQGGVEYLRRQPYVVKDKIMIIGHSQGGWAALAAASVAMDGVLGTVNVGGGANYASMGNGMITPEVQEHWIWACGALGASAVVPTLWIYSENDRNHPPVYVRRMFAAYQSAGGKATLAIMPPYDDDGHRIAGEPTLFWEDMAAFFTTVGFVTE
jgi:dienelactone hydrolase